VFWLNNRDSRGPAEVKDLAYRNSMIIATSCCCGPNETGRMCPGGSNVTDATGAPLAEIWDREGIIMATVNPSQALKLRQDNPWYVGLRPELYCNQPSVARNSANVQGRTANAPSIRTSPTPVEVRTRKCKPK